MNMFKIFLLSMVVLAFHLNAAPPKQLGAYLEENKITKGEVVKLDVPTEFFKFDKVLLAAKKKDAKWFTEYFKKHNNSPVPPYHEKLGLTKAEYDKYKKLWDKRKYVRLPKGKVEMLLSEDKKGEWSLNVTGRGLPISLLKYIAKDDTFKSSNGILERQKDINSPPDGVYREWKGHEWSLFKEGRLVRTAEHIAIGRTVHKDPNREYGILIYTLNEVTRHNTPLDSSQIIIRFVPKKRKK